MEQYRTQSCCDADVSAAILSHAAELGDARDFPDVRPALGLGAAIVIAVADLSYGGVPIRSGPSRKGTVAPVHGS